MDKERVMEEFKNYLAGLKFYKKNTLTNYIMGAHRFMAYLESNGLSLSGVDAPELDKYYSLKKTNLAVSRYFLKYLEMNHLILCGAPVSGETISVWLDRYLEHQERRRASGGLSESSAPAAGYVIRKFISYLDENNISDIRSVSRKVLEEYSAGLLLRKARNTGKPYAASSRYRIMTMLKDFFHYLKKEGIILADPAAYIELPKVPRTISRDIPKLEEINRLISFMDKNTPLGLRNRAMIEIMYGTGLRVQEILNLRIEDIDFENRYVTVREGKNKKDRVVPVNLIALESVKEYMGETGERQPGEYVFLKEESRGRIDIQTVRGMISVYARKAGIKKHLVPHSFRYACATHMLYNGADIRYIQEMLGHSCLSTTQGYTKVVKEGLKRMLRRFHPREGHDAV